MAGLYLTAFRQWFDSNQEFLVEHGVTASGLLELQDQAVSYAHADIETNQYLGNVRLWEYDKWHARADTDFVEKKTGKFHPKHYELYCPQDLDLLLSEFVLHIIEAAKPQLL